MSENTPKQTKRTSKQIAALIGVILLAALYIITLLVAVFAPASAGGLFQACLAATIAVPFLIWIYIWMYGKLTGRHTMADFDYNIGDGSNPDNSESEEA